MNGPLRPKEQSACTVLTYMDRQLVFFATESIHVRRMRLTLANVTFPHWVLLLRSVTCHDTRSAISFNESRI
uniref:Uncharacterized protein n=1 Tax=Hyaloperonospora arabidopsidis (strain Emoy2) TaxID=559515 RepID=M4BP35_HYAAE